MAAPRCLGLALSRSLAVGRLRPCCPSRQPQRGSHLTPSDDEFYLRTSIQRLERDSGQSMVLEGYNSWGFTISGCKVLGPCAVFPRAILQWNVGTHTDITAESLTLFRLLEPQIEILVLGTGVKVERLDPAILRFMRQCRIAVEVQDTPNACATFNFLASERRVTAAGLIPPSSPHLVEERKAEDGTSPWQAA